MVNQQPPVGLPSPVDPRVLHLLLATTALLVLGVAAFAVDLPLTAGLHRLPLPGDVRRLVTYSEVFGHGIGVALIILTAAVLDRRGWRVLLSLSVYAYGSGLLADVLKLLVARHRPYHGVDFCGPVSETFIGFLPWFGGLGPAAEITSFPSAHAATAVGLALGLSRLYPRGRFLFALFACLAGLQRVISLSHFPSDVLIGAAIACGLASVVARPWSLPSKLLRAGGKLEQGKLEGHERGQVPGKKPAAYLELELE